MLKNFLYISVRHILNKKGTSGINIFCLSLGGAICLLIWSFIRFEYEFDQSFTHQSSYRLETHITAEGGSVTKDAFTSIQLTQSLTRDWDQVKHFTQLVPYSEEGNAFFNITRVDGSSGKVHLKNVFFGDSSLFDVFPIEVMERRPNDHSKSGIWLSKSAATNIFGNEFSTNQALWHVPFQANRNNGLPGPALEIAGFFEDLPLNTHVRIDAIVLSENLSNPLNRNGDCYTYIVTKTPIDELERTREIVGLPENHRIYARPIPSIHFTPDISNNQRPVANKTLLIFLGIIGAIVILLSITNYTIGTIFSTIERMREIGIRKLIGMKPSHLMANFFTESLLIHTVAAIVSVAIFQYMTSHSLWFLPDTKELGMNNPLDLKAIGSLGLKRTIGFATGLFLFSTVLSSLYPMIYFNRIRPVHLLKGKLQLLNSRLLAGATRFTEALLMFQLMSSVIFLSGLFIVNRQLDHLNNQRIASFDLNVRGIFPGVAGVNETFSQMAELRLNDARNEGWLRDISYSNLYRDELTTVGTIKASTKRGAQDGQEFKLHVVDPSFWSQDDFKVGSNFSPHFGSNSTSIILNEAAIDQLELGKTSKIIGDTIFSNMGQLTIEGIVADAENEAIGYVTGFRYRTYLELTLHYEASATRHESVSDFLRAREVSLSSAFPFITLLKRDFQKEHFMEKGIAGLFLLFSILALLIASFGLFSLSTYLTEKRAKEMDIRKLLGANEFHVIQLVSSGLVQMIFWAIIISSPIIFFSGNYWLDQYPARIDFNMLLILIPALLVLVTSLLVAIPKSWQQSRSNLAESLRNG